MKAEGAANHGTATWNTVPATKKKVLPITACEEVTPFNLSVSVHRAAPVGPALARVQEGGEARCTDPGAPAGSPAQPSQGEPNPSPADTRASAAC